MQITIVVSNGQSEEQELIIPVPDVSATQTLSELKNTIEPFIGISAKEQQLFFQNRPLQDNSSTLEGNGIQNEDMVYVVRLAQRQKPAERKAETEIQTSAAEARDAESETMRQAMLNDPEIFAKVKHGFPDLADAVNDAPRFTELRAKLMAPQQEREAAKFRLEQRLAEDPFDVEAQKEIEEMIRIERVAENYEQAREDMPELFGQVTMLYIPLEVNQVPVKAFVDSGAQITTMSPSCAEKCGIMRLLDRRFHGEVRGVGTAKVLGKVHSAPIKIGQKYLVCSFTIVEGKAIDMLLGLDMLKRYQACVDLEKSVLRIAGDEVPFLPESEIPKNRQEEEEEAEAAAAAAASAEKAMAGKNAAVTGGESSSSAAASTRQHWQGTQALGSQAPAAAGKSSTAASSSAPTTYQSDAEKVQQLVQMGFDEAQARQALEIAQGNVEIAASFLFGG